MSVLAEDSAETILSVHSKPFDPVEFTGLRQSSEGCMTLCDRCRTVLLVA